MSLAQLMKSSLSIFKIIFVILIIIAAGYYFYHKSSSTNQSLENPVAQNNGSRSSTTPIPRPPNSFSNLIIKENQKPGTTDWIITKPSKNSDHHIEGYASSTSASANDTVDFYINT